MLVAGKYRLSSVLGEGGFGTVYKAEHVNLHRNAERVVKIIKPEVFAVSGMDRRFVREVQVTSDISQRNEHIVRIYDDFGEIPNLGHFYVMEYLQGEPLTHYIVADRLPAIQWSLSIFKQLCDAMWAAHEEGVVHRDLKPDNLLLIKRRRQPYFVKVLDFGIAKPVGADGTDTRLTQGAVGTPFYMSPEQGMNKGADKRADIYSMGVILFELLTGRIPFVPEGRENDISALEVMTSKLMKQPAHPCDVRPDRNIPRALGDVVLKALTREPADRIQTAEAFWLEIKEAAGPLAEEPAAEHHLTAATAQIAPEQPPINRSGNYLSNAPTAGPPSLQLDAGSIPKLTTSRVETPVPQHRLEGPMSIPSTDSDASLQTMLPPEAQETIANQEIKAADVFGEALENGELVDPTFARPSLAKRLLPLFLLLLLGGGVFAFLYVQKLGPFAPEEPIIPAKEGEVQYGAGLKGLQKKIEALKKGGSFERHSNQMKEKRHAKRAVVPEIRPQPRPRRRKSRRRKKLRRRKTHRRRLVRKHKARRKVHKCKSSWTYLTVSPHKANVEYELRNRKSVKAKRVAKGFCIPPYAKRVSVDRNGYTDCVFRIRHRRSRLHIRLRRSKELSVLSEGYCLKK
tara:strand:- start:1605 stop:3482 length:1878 start_codon:yes stop_codon:yes gene_type:complete